MFYVVYHVPGVAGYHPGFVGSFVGGGDFRTADSGSQFPFGGQVQAEEVGLAYERVVRVNIVGN